MAVPTDITTSKPRVEPRVAVLLTAALLLTISLIPLNALWAYPWLYALILAAGLAAGLSPLALLRRSWVIAPFVIAAAPLPFVTAGPVLWQAGPLAVSVPGVLRLLTVLFKAWLSVQAAAVLLHLLPINRLLWALGALRVPSVLVMIISLTHRFLLVLQDETVRLLRARDSRTVATGRQGWLRRLRWQLTVAGRFIASLFVRTLNRSERVYHAMTSRGYDGVVRLPPAAPLTGRDIVLLAVFVVALGLLLATVYFS